MRAAGKFVTDDVNQFRYYQTLGYFKNVPDEILDLGDVAAGKTEGRETPEERTMAMNLGLAINDMATAPLVYKKAIEKNIGVKLPL